MTDPIAIGQRFIVNDVQEVRDKAGTLLARYRPDFDYRVTPRNLEVVAGMIAAGKASIGSKPRPERPPSSEDSPKAPRRRKSPVNVKTPSRAGRLRGTISTGPAK